MPIHLRQLLECELVTNAEVKENDCDKKSRLKGHQEVFGGSSKSKLINFPLTSLQCI